MSGQQPNGHLRGRPGGPSSNPMEQVLYEVKKVVVGQEGQRSWQNDETSMRSRVGADGATAGTAGVGSLILGPCAAGEAGKHAWPERKPDCAAPEALCGPPRGTRPAFAD